MSVQKKNTKGGIENLFFTFQKMIFDAIKKEMKDLNCSIPQIELLRCLKECGEISLTDTAKLLGVTKPSASVMVDGMETRGLVRRTTTENDRRGVSITLTPKSRTLIKTIEEKKKKVIAVLLKKMNSREQAELTTLLAKLIES